jgi:hypothetical protein
MKRFLKSIKHGSVFDISSGQWANCTDIVWSFEGKLSSSRYYGHLTKEQCNQKAARIEKQISERRKLLR